MESSSFPSRILVVEDDPSLQILLKAVLEMAGHKVLCALTAPAALDCLLQHDFDALLTDFNLPGTSGLELFRYLGSQNSPIARRTVFLSASQLDEFAPVSPDARAQPFVQKPFVISELLDSLDRVLQPAPRLVSRVANPSQPELCPR